MLLSICSIVIRLQAGALSDHQSIPKKYDMYELLIINGTSSDVGISLEQHNDLTRVGLLSRVNKSNSACFRYHHEVVPTKTVRAFSIKKSRLREKAKRSSPEKRAHTERVYGSFLSSFTDEQFQQRSERVLPSQVFGQLLF